MTFRQGSHIRFTALDQRCVAHLRYEGGAVQGVHRNVHLPHIAHDLHA